MVVKILQTGPLLILLIFIENQSVSSKIIVLLIQFTYL